MLSFVRYLKSWQLFTKFNFSLLEEIPKKFQEMWNIVIFRQFFFLEQGLKHVICCVEFRALCFAETHRYILCCYALFEIGLHDRVLVFGAHCCLGNMSHKAAFRKDLVWWKCWHTLDLTPTLKMFSNLLGWTRNNSKF